MDKTDQAWRELADDSGVLRRITGRAPNLAGYDVLELIFDEGVLRLTCDADTDEIIIAVSSAEDAGLAEVRDDPPLLSLLGKVISLAWTMVNNGGYGDAFQIRSVDLETETRDESCCQFEVAAAGIRVVEVGVRT